MLLQPEAEVVEIPDSDDNDDGLQLLTTSLRAETPLAPAAAAAAATGAGPSSHAGYRSSGGGQPSAATAAAAAAATSAAAKAIANSPPSDIDATLRQLLQEGAAVQATLNGPSPSQDDSGMCFACWLAATKALGTGRIAGMLLLSANCSLHAPYTQQ